METKKQFNIQLKSDLIEITKAMPNGILVFFNKTKGGSIFRSGDMNKVVRYADVRLSTLAGDAEKQFYAVILNVLNIVNDKYNKEIKAYLDVMKGQEAPCELPINKINEFLSANELSDFSGLVLCCNESNGFFSANGDMIGIGSIMMSAITTGNIPVYDLLTRIRQEIGTTRKGIN